MDEDLQQIFQIVQNKLSETSLTEINESIRNVILQYFDSTTSQYVNTENPSIQAIQVDSAEVTLNISTADIQPVANLELPADILPERVQFPPTIQSCTVTAYMETDERETYYREKEIESKTCTKQTIHVKQTTIQY